MSIELNRLEKVYNNIVSKSSDGYYVPYLKIPEFVSGFVEGAIDLGLDVINDIRNGSSGSGTGNEPKPPRPKPEDSNDQSRDKRFRLIEDLLKRVEDLKKEDYEFSAFGAEGGERAVNFGVFNTYRQRWIPEGYQAGELVKTIPLAPKEAKRFKSSRVSKKSYLEKRSEASENKYNTETQDTLRDISKIVREAKFKSSFNYSNNVGMEIPGIGNGQTSTKIDLNSERSSQRTKEAFRESVKKAAQEFKQNSKIEITTSVEEQYEFEESGEIINPNDELAMTCLFYELERRYRVSERIHKVQPVVLIAQEIPKPSAITDEWIINHDWILRRILLDKSFLEPLDYVMSSDHLSAKIIALDLEKNMEKQQELVETLERNFEEYILGIEYPRPNNPWKLMLKRKYDRDYPGWQEYDEEKVKAVYGDDFAEAIAQRKSDAEKTKNELAIEAASLKNATASFHDAYREYSKKMMQVHRLQLHIKSNIIYYMQAIWDHENPDERFMRLQNTPVPDIKGDILFNLLRPSVGAPRFLTWEPPLEYEGSWDNLELGEDYLKLIEVADLGNLMGYFGNYMIFPLLESNVITDFMMAPYLEEGSWVKDPDDFGNFTLTDLDKYVCCLKKNMSTEDFNEIKPSIDKVYEARLTDPRPDEEEIIIPTESLFIEILPSEHTVLEKFKLQHRAVDVQKAVAEVIKQQLENLRYAGRLINEDFSDPEVDKYIHETNICDDDENDG